MKVVLPLQLCLLFPPSRLLARQDPHSSSKLAKAECKWPRQIGNQDFFLSRNTLYSPQVSTAEHNVEEQAFFSALQSPAPRLSPASLPTDNTGAQQDACTLSPLGRGRKNVMGTQKHRNQPDSSSSPRTERDAPDNRKFVPSNTPPHRHGKLETTVNL